MKTNPIHAAAIATVYRLWTRSHSSITWESLGKQLAIMADKLGGWDAVDQFAADNLSSIPRKHLQLAYADHIRAQNSQIPTIQS